MYILIWLVCILKTNNRHIEVANIHYHILSNQNQGIQFYDANLKLYVQKVLQPTQNIVHCSLGSETKKECNFRIVECRFGKWCIFIEISKSSQFQSLTKYRKGMYLFEKKMSKVIQVISLYLSKSA